MICAPCPRTLRQSLVVGLLWLLMVGASWWLGHVIETTKIGIVYYDPNYVSGWDDYDPRTDQLWPYEGF